VAAGKSRHGGRLYYRLGRMIDFNRKDRATRGASACAARAIPQIVNIQFRLVRVGFSKHFSIKGGRMDCKNCSTLIKTTMVLALTAILLFQFTPVVDAKKIRFSVGFTADQTLESPRANESWQYTAMGCAFWPVIYDQLWILGPAPDYKILPRLATGWETKDRKTWRFYLHKDAKFHDGKPVKAHDVAFTMTYLPKIFPRLMPPIDNVIPSQLSMIIPSNSR
jgi:hypothetical protein